MLRHVPPMALSEIIPDKRGDAVMIQETCAERGKVHFAHLKIQQPFQGKSTVPLDPSGFTPAGPVLYD